jgi:phosphatidylglycerol:prolipoprotein diacylglycerol transferase
MHPVLFQIGSLVVPSYGVCAALGVLLALGLAQTARRLALRLDPRHAWNMLMLAVFSSLATSRLLLIAMNLSDLRHSSALAAGGGHGASSAADGAGAARSGRFAVVYARWARLPLAAGGRCLAAPVSLGMAAEQVGALLAGSDFGRETRGQPGP